MAKTVVTVKSLDQDIKILEAKREELFKQKEPIEDALVSNYTKLEKLKNQLGSLKESTTGFSIKELMLYNRLNESDALYKAQTKFFEDNGFHSGGFIPDTEKDGFCQRGFSVTFYRQNHPIKLSISEQIDRVIAFFTKFHKDMLPVKNGMFFLDVFEHTLSEYGTYNILVSSDLKTAELIKQTYGYKTVPKKGTFKEVLEYVAENHYYE